MSGDFRYKKGNSFPFNFSFYHSTLPLIFLRVESERKSFPLIYSTAMGFFFSLFFNLTFNIF